MNHIGVKFAISKEVVIGRGSLGGQAAANIPHWRQTMALNGVGSAVRRPN